MGGCLEKLLRDGLSGDMSFKQTPGDENDPPLAVGRGGERSFQEVGTASAKTGSNEEQKTGRISAVWSKKGKSGSRSVW